MRDIRTRTGCTSHWNSVAPLYTNGRDYPSYGTPFVAGRGEREERRIREQAGGAFELGDLVEAGAGEGGPGRGDESAVGEVAGPFGQGAAEVVRVGAVVAAVDPGVGRGLVVPAGGDQHGVGAGDADAEPAGGMARSLRSGRRHFRVREEAAPVGGVGRGDAAGTGEIPAGNGAAGVYGIRGTSEAGHGMEVSGEGEVAQAGAGVTAVEDDGEEGPLRDVDAGGGEVVIGKRMLPVEVVRAEDLVEPVGRLVAVPVRHLGAVAGIVEDEGVARGGPRGEPGEPVEDRIRGGAGVGQD